MSWMLCVPWVLPHGLNVMKSYKCHGCHGRHCCHGPDVTDAICVMGVVEAKGAIDVVEATGATMSFMTSIALGPNHTRSF